MGGPGTSTTGVYTTSASSKSAPTTGGGGPHGTCPPTSKHHAVVLVGPLPRLPSPEKLHAVVNRTYLCRQASHSHASLASDISVVYLNHLLILVDSNVIRICVSITTYHGSFRSYSVAGDLSRVFWHPLNVVLAGRRRGYPGSDPTPGPRHPPHLALRRHRCCVRHGTVHRGQPHPAARLQQEGGHVICCLLFDLTPEAPQAHRVSQSSWGGEECEGWGTVIP